MGTDVPRCETCKHPGDIHLSTTAEGEDELFACSVEGCGCPDYSPELLGELTDA